MTTPEYLKKYSSEEFLKRLAVPDDECARRQAEYEAQSVINNGNGKHDPVMDSDRWPNSFRARCRKIGVRRYMRDLASVMDLKLPENELFRSFREAWRAMPVDSAGAIVLGNTGAGKSVVSLWACLKASEEKRSWDFLDVGEFADLWAMQDRERIDRLRECDLLVIDEVGDCADLKGAAIGLVKRTINARYRNDLPTVLCTTQNLDLMKTALGDEVVDRFPIRISAHERRSFRHEGVI